MAIYIILGVLTIIVALFSPRDKAAFFGLCIFLAIVGFFRSENVGTDCIAYSDSYYGMTFNPVTWNKVIPFEPGFNIVCAFFNQCISRNPMILLGLIPVFYLFCVAKFLRKYVHNINIALMLLFLLGSYTVSFNIMRQCFAFSFIALLFSKVDLENLKRTDYIKIITITIIIAVLFHSTMFCILIIPLISFILRKREISKSVLILLVIASLFAFYSNFMVNSILGIVEKLGVSGKLINYAVKNAQIGETSGFSLLKVSLISLWSIFIIIVSPSKPNIHLLTYISGVCFLNIFGVLVVEFARVYEIAQVFGIIYMTQLWSKTNNRYITRLYRVAVILYAIVIFSNILLKNYGEIVPYEFRI